MILFFQKYQGTSVQELALNGIFSPCKAFVFLLLAEYHFKRIFKEQGNRNSYQFLNVPNHEWHNWKIDDGSLILSELVVKLFDSK